MPSVASRLLRRPPPPLPALYPIDTIKTRLQAMRSGGGIRALLQAGGGRGLYAGVWGNLVGVAPASAIFMAVYEPVKQVGQSVMVWAGGRRVLTAGG
jgi:hypothetical protein